MLCFLPKLKLAGPKSNLRHPQEMGARAPKGEKKRPLQSKGEAILGGVCHRIQASCRADAFVPMRFAIFHSTSVTYFLRLQQKQRRQVIGRVIQSVAGVTQNHFSKPEETMLQNATFCKKSAPWPSNMLGRGAFLLRIPRDMHLSDFQTPHACHSCLIRDDSVNLAFGSFS